MIRSFEGALWKAFACLCFAGMNGLITALMHQLHFLEVAFFEHLFALLWLAPFVWKNRVRVFVVSQPFWHVFRILASVLGVVFWYQALRFMPMAQAVALGFVGPLTTTIGACLILKERLTKGRLIAIILGVLGVVFIQRSWCVMPDAFFNCWVWLPLASSFAFSLSTLASKKLTFQDHPLLITTTLCIFMTPLFGFLAWPFFKMPSAPLWGALLALGGLTALAHFALTRSFVCRDLIYLLPIGSLRFVFTACVGYFFFNQKPLFSVYLGFFVIFTALCVLSLVERQGFSRFSFVRHLKTCCVWGGFLLSYAAFF